MSLYDVPVKALTAIIRLYQKTLSLDHGLAKRLYPYGYCKFHPTCSEYAIQAINRYGVLVGSLRALRRLLRCHPWSAGGFDPVK